MSSISYKIGSSPTFVGAAITIEYTFGDGEFEIIRLALSPGQTTPALMQAAWLYDGPLVAKPHTHVDVLGSGYGTTIENLVVESQTILGPGTLRMRKYSTGTLSYRLTYRKVKP